MKKLLAALFAATYVLGSVSAFAADDMKKDKDAKKEAKKDEKKDKK